MNCRVFLTTVGVGVVATPVTAGAQKTKATRQVGFLCVGSREQFAHLLLAFEQRLAELGRVPGKDVSIEPRFAKRESDLARLAPSPQKNACH
jgi:hypothetical protein